MLKLDIKNSLYEIEEKAKELYKQKSNNTKKEIGSLIISFLISIIGFLGMAFLINIADSNYSILISIIITIGILISGCFGVGALFYSLVSFSDMIWDKKYNEKMYENKEWMYLAFNYNIINMNFFVLEKIKNLKEDDIKNYHLDLKNSNTKLVINTEKENYSIYLDELELPDNMNASDMILKIVNSKIVLKPTTEKGSLP